MTLKVKGWERFQHFKDRKPPWIKLYRDLLDDLQWHELAGDDAKTLVMLWLIASEKLGELPSIKELAFRLRVSEKAMKSTVSRLSHWLIQDDIKPISDIRAISTEHQADDAVIPLTRSQELETEKETETDAPDGFDLFYKTYPKKVGRPAAAKAFKSQKINGELPDILADIEKRIQGADWQKDSGQYIPNPATYLNQRRWEDGASAPTGLGNFL